LISFQKNAAKIKTLVASFTQKKQLSILQDSLLSKGHFCLDQSKKNSKFLLWEYTEPLCSGFFFQETEAQILLNGRKHKRKPSAEEALLFKAMAEQIQTWTSFNLAKIERNYTISKVKEGQFGFVLTPKKATAFFKSLTVFLDPKLLQLTSLHFQEKNGDETSLFFHDQQLNADWPDFCNFF
ncbi:MAG: outer membrane lipoprotein carrier protein LolA, partial [Desulfovibrio sp.]|nr:outer membrane lipoprotein carrier protein LolA [Desulfovibrio sp.]